MAKSSNGYVPKGLHHNKVWSAKHKLTSADRTMTPQYRVTLGLSPRTTKAEIETTQPRRGAMVLSPRQARKQARLLALADEQATNLSLRDRQKAAERATVNAERGAIAATRRDKTQARIAGMVESEVKRRDSHDNMAWFARQIAALVAI